MSGLTGKRKGLRQFFGRSSSSTSTTSPQQSSAFDSKATLVENDNDSASLKSKAKSPSTTASKSSLSNSSLNASSSEYGDSLYSSPISSPSIDKVEEEENKHFTPLNPYAAISGHSEKSDIPQTFTEKAKDVAGVTYEGIKITLNIIEKPSDAFLPLKAPVAALRSVMEIVDKTIDNKQEFQEMQSKLEAVIRIIRKYENGPSTSAISERVKQLANDLKLYIDEISRLCGHGLVRRLLENAKDADAVVKSFRNIGFLFSAFQMDTALSAEANTEQIAKDVASLKNEGALGKLQHVPTASFEAQRHDGCLTGTREDILREIFSWAIDVDSPRVFWLNGMAGLGKSAIALTLCRWLSRNHMLGASFFCSRQGAVERRDVGRIFPTLARFLARTSPSYEAALIKALERDSDVAHQTFDKQFVSLMEGPGEHLKMQKQMPVLVVVIDALDECDKESDTAELLRILLDQKFSIPIKLFLTSRPDLHIRNEFDDPDLAKPKILRLHDVTGDATQGDIRFYYKQKFEELRRKRRRSFTADKEWPDRNQLVTLVGLTSGLFIYAFTVFEFIQEPKADPEERLTWILGSQLKQLQTLNRPLDSMYRLILQNALDGLEDREIAEIKRVLAAIACLRDSRSIETMGHLLGITPRRVRIALAGVHSLIRVPENDEGDAVSAFHISFIDYLIDRARSGEEPWHVDPPPTNIELADRCLDILLDELDFNISSSGTSYLSNQKQSRNGGIPSHLEYACRFWVDHITLSPPSSDQWSKIHDLLHYKLLYWLEVMSVLGKVDDTTRMLQKIFVSATSEISSAPDNIKSFIKDASEFIITFREPISLSAPHIYLSAMPFIRHDSQISLCFRDEFPLTLAPDNLGDGSASRPIICIEQEADVLRIALSLDGTQIASGSSDNTVQIWDANSGEAKSKPLTGHSDAVKSVGFSPDGQHIASGSSDRTIRLWHVGNASGAMVLEGHTDSVYSVAFSSDGRRVVSGSKDRTVRIWNAESGKAMKCLEGHTDSVTSVAISPDRRYVVSGSEDDTIRIWNTMTGKMLLRPLEGHRHYVLSVAISPDGRNIASGSGDCTIRIWDLKSGQASSKPFVGHVNFVLCVAYSHDGRFILSSSVDKSIRIWDAQTGSQMIKPLIGHTADIYSVIFSPDERRIFSGSKDRTIRIWDIEIGEEVIEPSEGHTAWVRAAVISPDGRYLVSCSDDLTIRLWDMATGQLAMKPLEGHTAPVFSVVFTPDCSRILSGSADCTIRVWSVDTGNMVQKPWEGHTDSVNCVVLSPDGRHVASGSIDMTVRIWNAHTGEASLNPLKGHESDIYTVSYSGDGRRIISASDDCTVRIWDADAGTLLSTLTDEGMDWVISAAFAPHGLTAVSGSKDSIVRIWDTTTNKLIKRLRGHTIWVKTVAYSPNGKYIVSGGRDCVIKSWDASTGEAISGTWKGHSEWVNCLTFSPDGRLLVSGSSDCTIRIWDAEYDEQSGEALRQSATDHRALKLVYSETGEAIPLSLNKDGWIIGPKSELLLWIPVELRRGLWWENTTAILGAPVTELDLSDFVHGDDWVYCKV